jgi:large subunit ribosomal protein L4
MQIDVVNMEGQKVGQMEVAEEVFGCKVREHLLWEMVKAQQAAKRAGTHATKTREFVRGGGKKPYRQKGTGNARQGSTRSPNFVGGGKVFGPHPRDYGFTLPRKVKKAALAAALSLRAQEKKLVIVEKLVMETPKSKRLTAVFKALGVDSALVVENKGNSNLTKSMTSSCILDWLLPKTS